MSTTQNSANAVAAHPGLKPFAKGYDPRRHPGGLDPRTKRVRKKLAKLDDTAMKVLAEMFASDDPFDRREALKFWGKYRLPVPTEKTADAPNVAAAVQVPPSLAAKLAALDS